MIIVGMMISVPLLVAETRAGQLGWGSPVLVGRGEGGDAWAPQIAMDRSGNSVVAWTQEVGTRGTVWANRYESGAGWGRPSLIGDDSARDFGLPRVAISESGDAIAVWEAFTDDVLGRSVWESRYVAGQGWTTASPVPGASENSQEAQVGMGPNGTALVVWEAILLGVGSNRFVPGTGWSDPTLISPDDEQQYGQRLSINDRGDGVAVWVRRGNETEIWANSFVADSGWSNASAVGAADSSSFPELAVAPDGSAVAVWSTGHRPTFLWASEFSPGVGWGNATILQQDTDGGSQFPAVAMDGLGRGTVVWAHSGLWSSRYVPGDGWQATVQLDSRPTGDAVVVADPSGNAMAVWSPSGEAVRTSRFDAATGWANSTPLDGVGSDGFARSMGIASAKNGDVRIVWRQREQGVGTFDDWTDIWSDKYTASDATDTTPPLIGEVSVLPGEQGSTFVVRVPVQDEGGVESVILYYQPDGSQDSFEAGMILAEAGVYEVGLPQMMADGGFTYRIVAVDAAGNEGQSRELVYRPDRPMSAQTQTLLLMTAVAIAVVVALVILSRRRLGGPGEASPPRQSE